MNGRPNPDDFPVVADMQIQRLVDDLRIVYVMQKRAHLATTQKRKRVLVVEDHIETRQLICMTVQFEDHEVFEADSGDTGLAMALELKPDLVTLDVLMPGALDGLHVCRALKAMPDPPQVLILTGQGGYARRDAGHKAGADAYLLKPFSPLQLIDIINEQLEIA